LPEGVARTSRVWLKAGLLGLVLLGLYWLYRETDYQQYMTRAGFSAAAASLRGYVYSLGILGPIVFVGVSVIAIMAYIPAVVVIYFSVCVFGGVRGALISAASIYLSVSAIYFTARYLGRDLVVRAAGPSPARFESRLSGRGLLAVVYLRLLFFVAPPTNWLLGLSGLQFRDVFWGTVLGSVHHIIIFSWLTEVVVEVLRTGGSLNPFETRELLIPLLVGASILVAVRLVDRRIGRVSPISGYNSKPQRSPRDAR
jgi:uncharacterized membrane protein YdjX (TVP38/TMEM64 family)